MTLTELVNRFLVNERPLGVVLDERVVMAQAVAATVYYDGYIRLASTPAAIDETTALNNFEWAVIRPLFLLYVERETALYLEAAQVLGVTLFGRGSEAVQKAIAAAESGFREQINTVKNITAS
jgi:multisubunit Na+/H+ antiporter MnhF subunit